MNLAEHLHPLPAVDEVKHWNRAEDLAPVMLWLLVKMGNCTCYARRMSHIEKKNRDMEYQLADGTHYTGKLEWTYP